MANQFPPIFIISLKHSPRRQTIANRLDGLGIRFEFIDAVYGKDLTKEELEQVDYEFYPQKYLSPKKLTLGEIGCAMSHIKVYEHIVANNIQQAIILEDDAIVSQEFERIVKDVLNKIPARKEIIFFDHGKAKSWLFKRMLVDRYKLARYREPSKNSKRCIITAAAYLITLSGAQKLLKHAYPIRMPADYLTGLLQMTHIHAYGVDPPCVFRGIGSEVNEIEHRYK